LLEQRSRNGHTYSVRDLEHRVDIGILRGISVKPEPGVSSVAAIDVTIESSLGDASQTLSAAAAVIDDEPEELDDVGSSGPYITY
jgi:hypothetical protein